MSFQKFINLAVFTPGSALFSLDHTAVVVGEHATLSAVITQAKTQAQETLAINQQWAVGQGVSGARGEAQQLDVHIDRMVGGIFERAQATRQIFPKDTPEYAAADAIMRGQFPKGAAALTTLKFEDEYAQVSALHAALIGPAAAHIATLGATHMVVRLGTLLPLFKAELDTPQKAVLTFDTVRASRAALQQAMRLAVAHLLVAYSDDPETLHTVLAPIAFQDARIRKAHNRSRRVSDVNPETGIEIETVPV